LLQLFSQAGGVRFWNVNRTSVPGCFAKAIDRRYVGLGASPTRSAKIYVYMQ
jgi:hypothetical protein